MSRRSNRIRPMAEINVVPYIDVMLVLLVIFMITAPLLTQGVHVELPRAEAEPVAEESQPPLVVTVDAAGGFHLNWQDRSLDLDGEALEAEVKRLIARHPGLQVLVKGDRRVDYGRVVQAMVRLQAAGAEGVGLVTEPGEE